MSTKHFTNKGSSTTIVSHIFFALLQHIKRIIILLIWLRSKYNNNYQLLHIRVYEYMQKHSSCSFFLCKAALLLIK